MESQYNYAVQTVNISSIHNKALSTVQTSRFEEKWIFKEMKQNKYKPLFIVLQITDMASEDRIITKVPITTDRLHCAQGKLCF